MTRRAWTSFYLVPLQPCLNQRRERILLSTFGLETIRATREQHVRNDQTWAIIIIITPLRGGVDDPLSVCSNEEEDESKRRSRVRVAIHTRKCGKWKERQTEADLSPPAPSCDSTLSAPAVATLLPSHFVLLLPLPLPLFLPNYSLQPPLTNPTEDMFL